MAKNFLKRTLGTKLLSINMHFAINAYISNTTKTKLRTYATRSGESELIKEKVGNKAILTLNRGASKNSLTLELTNEIIATLNEWESDSRVASIIFKAKGDAFCTGIDFRDVFVLLATSNIAENRFAIVESVPDLLKSYYKLYYKLATLKKPNASLINGMIHNSAIGVSNNHTYTVCTENAVFLMPETGYGLMPDCFFASRIPDKLRLYLALTGDRIKGRNLYNIGMATHYIPSSKLINLENDLRKVDDIDAVIGGIYRYQNKGEICKREAIEHFYRIHKLMNTVKSIDDIFQLLKSDGDQWSKQQLTLLSQRSPLALKITYKYFEKHECDLKECLKKQYRITKRLIVCKDFQESLRSVIANKEIKPKWSKTLNEIDDSTVNSFLSPSPNDELKLD